MPWIPASLLLHRGHGTLHADLILGTGPRCVTVGFRTAAGRWRVKLGVPHRRRYLTYRGPVPGGRGAVVQLWRGLAWWMRSAATLRLRLHPNQVLLMKMRRISGALGSVPKALRRGRGEVVVPLHRAATLPRS